MKKAVAVLLTAVLLVLCLAACGNGEEPANTFRIYLGLNDADTGTQLLTLEEAQSVARETILDQGLGYTEYVAYGGYKDDTGAVQNNDTLVYTLIFTDQKTVTELTKVLKEKLNIGSILIETTESVSFFSE